jgi:hypothetical protein
MKINIIKMEKSDTVMIHHNIDALPNCKVDEYCSDMISKLVEIFGEKRVALFPTREGDRWEFTIVKKTI